MIRSKEYHFGEIAVDEKERKHIAEALKEFLAETYSLYLLTQNFHWNVNGVWFNALHALFEKQYQDLAAATDSIAERIRALGYRAPGSFREFSELSSLKEAAQVPEAEEMICLLVDAHSIVAQKAHQIVNIANDAQDWGTADLMADRIMQHEKVIWMLKSSLSAKAL